MTCAAGDSGGGDGGDELAWIPGRILRCVFDRDVPEFRPQAMDVFMGEALVPPSSKPSIAARCWAAASAVLDRPGRRALAALLSLKRRLQEDFAAYLELRQELKDMPQAAEDADAEAAAASA
eukprot:SM003394S12860  [mRNA]  locus=s3394:1:967:- [translate_table: standard]